MKVLIVDDSPTMRRIIISSLHPIVLKDKLDHVLGMVEGA